VVQAVWRGSLNLGVQAVQARIQAEPELCRSFFGELGLGACVRDTSRTGKFDEEVVVTGETTGGTTDGENAEHGPGAIWALAFSVCLKIPTHPIAGRVCRCRP